MFYQTALGSSPRVWEQVCYQTDTICQARIIPTRVGTSAKNALLLLTLRDHPYACGDKQGISAHTQARHGSSPRVWGQAEKMNLKNLQKRIIPTRVGTRISAHSRKSEYRDHPHACGDKCQKRTPALNAPGSSLRVWGQARDIGTYSSSARIIPTRVGTS